MIYLEKEYYKAFTANTIDGMRLIRKQAVEMASGSKHFRSALHMIYLSHLRKIIYKCDNIYANFRNNGTSPQTSKFPYSKAHSTILLILGPNEM